MSWQSSCPSRLAMYGGLLYVALTGASENGRFEVVVTRIDAPTFVHVLSRMAAV